MEPKSDDTGKSSSRFPSLHYEQYYYILGSSLTHVWYEGVLCVA